MKKELGLFNIYALATGATLSSGFFLLPGLAFVETGPALMVSYLIAALILIPGLLSNAELATAMPRAGGIYYFLDRSMGPLMGTIGGLGTWLTLILKTAFALVGVGAYLHLFFPNLSMLPIAIILAVVLGMLNLREAKHAAGLQVVMVTGLLAVLFVLMGLGLFHVETPRFSGYFDAGFNPVFAAAGLVFVSYMGIGKIASVSEEVKDPEKNLPRAMFLALGTALVLYGVGTTVLIGVIPEGGLAGNMAPVATAVETYLGLPGKIVVTVAAVVAFISVANAGIMSGSRYPLAMSRDEILPPFFGKLTERGIPINSVFVTVGIVLVCLVTFDPMDVAKLGSAFQLLLFALNGAAVIIMRESHIDSYDPGYKAPWYPWIQIFGILASLVLIFNMGWLPILFTMGLLAVGAGWYLKKVRGRVARVGAVFHIFERLGHRRFEGLDAELRGILKEKGLREGDPFDEVVARADVIDLEGSKNFAELISDVSLTLTRRVPVSQEEMEKGFLMGTGIGATPVSHGAALPHIRLKDIEHTEMVLVRVRDKIMIPEGGDADADPEQGSWVQALFFLLSPQDNPGQHLRLLAQIAGRVDDDEFLHDWLEAKDDQTLKETLLRDERYLSIHVASGSTTEIWVGKSLRELHLPHGCLIAMIRRDEITLIPHGASRIREGDRLTVIGEPDGIRELQKRYDLH